MKNKICRRQVPFNLHAVYEFKPSSNDVSILVEIQIHDSEVRKASAAQQRFYQIFRAISSEKLHKVEAHHTMTHSKLMKQRSQRHMLRTAKISSSRALKALQRNFSVRNTGRHPCIIQKRLRADLHAIDATPARRRGDVGSSPLDGASA